MIFHAMIVVCESNIYGYLPVIGPYIVSAINNPNDENCARFACGLVSDLANYLEKNMQQYSTDFMSALNNVLQS